jgi:N-acetyl-anhydromuramyl-L-alanine amidase AmpD
VRLDATGWLESGDIPIERVPTSRHGALQVGAPVGVVWHATGSRSRTDAGPLWLANDIATGAGSSWHVLVARSGLCIQSVPFSRAAFHCRGRLSEPARGFVNDLTLGIEMENVGPVLDGRGVLNPHEPQDEWRPGKYEIHGDETAEVDGVLYHQFTAAQVLAASAIVRALPQTVRHHWSHSELDPGRKADPGPVWMLRHLPGILERAGR